jgi:hypothetical protein
MPRTNAEAPPFWELGVVENSRATASKDRPLTIRPRRLSARERARRTVDESGSKANMMCASVSASGFFPIESRFAV